MTTKTLNQWLKVLKTKKVLTKTDIQSLCNSANRMRWLEKNEVRLINAQTLLNKVYYGTVEFKITREQSQFGIEYLMRRYFKKDGSLRKRTYETLGDREIDILRNFKRFSFVGIQGDHSQYNTLYNIVYRIYGQDGMYFDYIPMHWGEIQVIN